MFHQFSEIFSFLNQTEQRWRSKFFTKIFANPAIAGLLEDIYDAPLQIFAHGIFKEDKDLWLPLKIASELKTQSVLRSIRPGRIYSDEPPIYGYRAGIAVGPETRISAGTYGISSLSPATALWRCLGEAVERFALAHFDEGKSRTATLKEVAKTALDPRQVAKFSQNQLNGISEAQIEARSVFRWVPGRSLTKRKKIWIPAQLVYGNYERLPQEPLIRKYVTTGAAAY